ncbi:unnamed protein product [Linum trigynum]|uniref:DUF4283 domain-containing protein n=1 Tax=Linum trigynum TaxID=586398 RepID=A0AAV2D1R5_9ROSI
MVWVQLPRLPSEFFNQIAVMRIVGLIGNPARVDRATLEGARMKYAHVCVEVDLTKPLLSKYKVEWKENFITCDARAFTMCVLNAGNMGIRLSNADAPNPLSRSQLLTKQTKQMICMWNQCRNPPYMGNGLSQRKRLKIWSDKGTIEPPSNTDAGNNK